MQQEDQTLSQENIDEIEPSLAGNLDDSEFYKSLTKEQE